MKKAATLLTLLLMSTAALFAQEKYGATEAEQQICKESLQIYKTFMDQKMDDNLVYKAWQTAHQECPCTASERLFSNGAKIIKKQIIASKEDKERLTVMIDSLMMIYDERIACYPSNKKYKDGMNAHYVAALKAGDMKKLLPKQKEEAFKLMETSVKALGNLATATLISNYYVDLYDHFKDAPDEEKDM